MGIRDPKIKLSPEHVEQLAANHKVTLTTVRNAIRYITDSQLAKDIRKSAKDMLTSEAKKVKI